MKTRRLVELSQQHEDRMLTWSVGLMGAGLFALPSLLSAACGPALGGRLLWTVAPWGGGILVALAGRVIGGLHSEADRFHFAGKWGGLQALLVRATATPEEFAGDLLAIMNDETEQLKRYQARVVRLRCFRVAFYYGTVLALAAGVVTVLWRIAAC